MLSKPYIFPRGLARLRRPNASQRQWPAVCPLGEPPLPPQTNPILLKTQVTMHLLAGPPAHPNPPQTAALLCSEDRPRRLTGRRATPQASSGLRCPGGSCDLGCPQGGVECVSDSLFYVSEEASLEMTQPVCVVCPGSLTLPPHLLQMKLEARVDQDVQVRPSDQQLVLPKRRIYQNLLLRKQPAKI